METSIVEKIESIPNYQRIPEVAFQWTKSGDSDLVTTSRVELIFDVRDNYYYVNHFDKSLYLPQGWLAKDINGDIAQTNGSYLPFSMYELHSGKHETIDPSTNELCLQYANYEKWNHLPIAHSYLTSDSNKCVVSGDWIVVSVLGEINVYNNFDFKKLYKRIEE